MISKGFLDLIYEGANIQRWNDHNRPHIGFSELDKQAHKFIFAYVLAKTEEDRGVTIDWKTLIEGGIFEYIHRVKLTDIKPPIFHQLVQKYGDKLNDWVFQEIKGKIEGINGDFVDRFYEYYFKTKHKDEKKILKAAHYLATNWEFNIIYSLNSTLYGLEQTKANIENQIEEHSDLAGVQKILLKKSLHAFLDLVGQLRYQKRWAQTPRIPETSVLGHMLIVAILAYICSLEIGSCNQRLYNNFFGGLFHDLPEVLTRDIISPVKNSVSGIDEMLKEIESAQIEEVILPLLPDTWRQEIEYFTMDEFESKIIDGTVKIVSSERIKRDFNFDNYYPLDGQIIEVCDKLAAYLEACISIMHGITSEHLTTAKKNLYEKHKNKNICGIDFGQLFDYYY